MIKRNTLVKDLNNLMNIYDYQDYGPNGLQIEGRQEIKKICFAVSATRASVAKAVELNADALIVHHGLFWKFHGPKTLTGAFYHRVAPLVKNDINLLGYHLPLDAHIEYGNAKAIADLIELTDLKPFGDHKGMPTGVKGKFKSPIDPAELKTKLEKVLSHSVIHSSPNEDKIKSMGIITGGANGDWVQAKRDGLDSYLTGEISEHDWHEAREDNIHFFAGGHNATEQFGVQYLLKYLQAKYPDCEYQFISSENPA
ncbi:MAG: Nif3-like dinuclear metal center hexameric protein [Halobacteriovoraceae bacterium]|nr:Nif3-like dinuclear metal center hexameric protein [Halobacteriovoraceae bacterium]|tara:strand:- start:1458 stop:2222 length:765 start_codon:yes stop_codon:yes gene_type:complete